MTSEFQLIDAFKAPFQTTAPDVAMGPGDDCAVLVPGPGRELCVTVDAAVDGVHFTSSRFTPEEIGRKALAMNLSDLAAMGASPRWFLCSVAYPSGDGSVEMLRGIAQGMAALAARWSVPLVGGNFTWSDRLSLHITAMGSVPSGGALRRDGARPGDQVFVSGDLGGASFGLSRLMAVPEAEARALPGRLRHRQCSPTPRMELGMALSSLASAAMDISDGLLQDAGHMCRMSGVGMELHPDLVPVDPMISSEGVSRGEALRHALTGGEDYELLATIPPDRVSQALQAAAEAGCPLARIGQVVSGNSVRLVGRDGEEISPFTGGEGFDHFANR